MRDRYEQLNETAEGLEEWKNYGEEFREIAVVLFGRTSGKRASSRERDRWMEKVVKAVGEKNLVWKRIEKNKGQGRQLYVGLLQLYGQNKKAARRAVDTVRNNMEEEV